MPLDRSPRFGRFELLDELGRGAMGIVYDAVQRDLDRRVALKLLPRDRLADTARVDALLHEARAAAAVHHPGLVAVFDAGVHDGQPYLAMERVEGEDLEQRVAAAPLAPRDAARLIADVASAVQALHEHGIVHRDLKPSNVLIDGNGHARVSDFGLAHVLGRDAESGFDGLAGTPGSMPPEQIDPAIGPVGPRSDVWAIGALLFRALSGTCPVPGETPVEQILATVDSRPRELRSVAPHVPRELAAIAMHCLAREPHDRYATAADVARELERWLAGESLDVRIPGAFGAVVNLARRHPMLTTHWVAIAATWVVGALDHFVFGVTDAGFFIPMSAISLALAGVSLALERRLATTREPARIGALWLIADAVAIAVVATLGDGPSSAVVQVLPLLIVGSALFRDERTVVVATVAAIAVDILLALHAAWTDSPFVQPIATTHIGIASQLILGAVVRRLVRHARWVADLAGRRRRD